MNARVFALVCLFLCVASFNVSAEPKKSAIQKGKTRSSNKGVEFELFDRKMAKFRITNGTGRALTLDSMFGDDSEEPYAPAYAMYQYLSHKRWVTLRWSGDAFVYSYTLKPGKSVVFEDSFNDLKRLKRGTLVRLRVGDFVSKPFRW